jgi:AcrR family transcriptional regulator
VSPQAASERSLGRGARARILEAARVLFARQGINATSINELRAAARVSKRTLYQQFASKDELVLAYLDESWRTGPAEALLDREDLAPRARLLEMFTTLADLREPIGPEPLVAAAVEFPDPGHPVHRAAVAHSQRFVARVCDLARAAGATDPEQVGRRLALLYTGAAGRAALDDRGAAVSDAYAIAAAILRDAID